MSSNIKKIEKCSRIDNEILEGYLLDLTGSDTSVTKNSLESIYTVTRVAVYGFIMTILKNPYDAEDVLQETYVQIYKSAIPYKPEGKPMAYIITVAKNQALMKIRKNKNISNLPEEEWSKFIADISALDIEDKVVLEGYLQHLSIEEKNIVVLHAISDFKYREIAQIYGMPLSTVLSKYSRAIKKLNEIYKKSDLKERNK